MGSGFNIRLRKDLAQLYTGSFKTYDGLHADSATFGNTGSGNYTNFDASGTIKFYGDATVWNDLRISANDITELGANPPTWEKFKDNGIAFSGSAFTLDGTSNYFELPHYNAWNVNTNGHLTLEFWLKPTEIINSREILYKNGYFDCYIETTGKIAVNIGIEYYALTPNPIMLNSWNHLVLVYKKTDATHTKLSIYLNGALEIERLYTTTFSTNSNDVVFGSFLGYYCYEGLIDDFAAYNIPLTLEQVEERYTNAKNPYSWPTGVTVATDVIAHFDFKETSGTIAYNDPLTLGSGSNFQIYGDNFEWSDGYLESQQSQGVYLLAFPDNKVSEVFFTCQFPHDYKLESNIYPHLHYVSNNSGQIPKFFLEYTWQKIGGIFSDTTVIESSRTLFNIPHSGTHNLIEFPVINGTGYDSVSSMIVCRLYRDPNDSGDTLTGSAYFMEFDFHYEIDAPGSDQLYIK